MTQPLSDLISAARLLALRPEQNMLRMLGRGTARRSWLEQARDDYRAAADNMDAALKQLDERKKHE